MSMEEAIAFFARRVLRRLFQVCRIDEPAHCGNAVGRNADSAGMLPDAVFVGRQVHAVDLIFGDVTMEPLNLRPHVLQRLQRLQRHLPDLGSDSAPSARDFAFDYELRHDPKSLTPNTGKIVISPPRGAHR